MASQDGIAVLENNALTVPHVVVAERATDITIGQGVAIIKDDEVTLDKGWAEGNFLNLPIFKGERPVRDTHVADLVRAMERGTFRPELVVLATAFVGDTRETLRVNGQHTAWAVYSLADDRQRNKRRPPVPYKVRFIRYRCRDMDAFRQLYASYDRGAPRTRSHVTNAYLAGTPEWDAVPTKVARVVPAAMGMWLYETDTERRRHDADEMAVLIKTTHATLAGKVAAFMAETQDKRHAHVHRAPVVAAMLATFARNVTASQEFWRAVVTGEQLNKDDPRFVLREFLLRARFAPGRTGNNSTAAAIGATRLVGGEYAYRSCLGAWNSWRAGEKRTVVKPGNTRPAVAA